MAGQLIPPPELAPPTPSRLSPQQRIALWAELTDTCEQFLLAGLRLRLGIDADLRAAYREWYAGEMEKHDRTMTRMMEELARRSTKNAG